VSHALLVPTRVSLDSCSVQSVHSSQVGKVSPLLQVLEVQMIVKVCGLNF
jgi:hypothetical protein